MKSIEYYMSYIDTTEVFQYIQELIEMAETRYKKSMKVPTISYDLKGKVAGKAFNKRNHIQLNPVLFAHNYDDFWNNTIPHEIAHLVSYNIYGNDGFGHGPLWKGVMYNCYGIEPKRCHDYDTNVNKPKGSLYIYKCSCKEHKITKVRHNRYYNAETNKITLRCNKCKTILEFTGETN